VRSPEEHAAGHPPGFISAPGGQLVQATDEWVAVRGARLPLYDDDGVRARMTASWLVQMGWEAVVIAEGGLTDSVAGIEPTLRPPLPEIGAAAIAPADLARLANATIVDLAPSPAYRRGHIPGAWFIAGARLCQDLATLSGQGPIVLTSPDGEVAFDNFADARAATRRPILALTGGTQAWTAAGSALQDDAYYWASQPDDVYKRPYEGTDNAREAMQAYLDWKLQLVAQLANDGVSLFHVVR
jgi:rhodanese-related sulfurtransferase